MIFVDTSAWYAAYVPTDPHHPPTSKLLRDVADQLVTSDFVIDETVTLLLARRERQRAVNFGRDLLLEKIVSIESTSAFDMLAAYDVFCRFQDKAWSFTDCASFALMRRIGVKEAISLDEHFRQMPGISVVNAP